MFPGHGAALDDLAQLLPAITKRATNRSPFAEEELPDGLVQSLQTAAEAEGVEIGFARTIEQRRIFADLIAEADRRQFDDPDFRRELSRWIRPSHSDDGMPAQSQGFEQLSDLATRFSAMAIRTFDIGKGVGAAHEQLARGSPLLLALSTPMDNNECWLESGQALQRVLLVATKAGYAASFLNQPIEVAELRGKLASAVGTAYPQLLLRVGHGSAVSHSPRRPLADVL